MADPVLFAVRDGVAFITLNRPEVGNAINLPMAQRLVEVAIRCETDRAIRCVVLTGAGRLFCVGGDVGAFAEAGDQAGAFLSGLAGTLHMAAARFARMECPFVTLVNGPVAGAGIGVAISGDVVLAARSAHFTASYCAIGLTPDGGLSWFLPRLVGLRKAQEILLTNRRIKAEEAEAIGLVTRIVEDADLAREGETLANDIAARAIGAIGATRRLLLKSFDNGLETHLDEEARLIAMSGMRPEHREGLAAYLAKRPADFKGV